MANKRQKKKQHKKELQQRFRSSENITYRKLLEKEERADKQRKQREKRYKKNLQLVAENGVNVSITKSMTEKQVKDLIAKEKRKQAEKLRQQKKIDFLIKNGFSKAEAEKNKNKSFKVLEAIANPIYTSEAWGGACWFDNNEGGDLIYVIKEARSLSTHELIEQVHDLYNTALGNPQGSPDHFGISFFVTGKTKEDVLKQLNNFKKRGYAWRIPANFANIGVSNQWSLNGVATMMYIGMAHTDQTHTILFYERVEQFCYTYLPEIYKRIW